MEQEIPVIREYVEVTSINGSDSHINLYRKPAPEISSGDDSLGIVSMKYFTVYIDYGNNIATFKAVPNYGSGVPYDEIITPDQVEVFISREGSMPDCWKKLDMKTVYKYGEFNNASYYTYLYGSPWKIDEENIFEETYLFPIWHNTGAVCEC